MKITQTFTFSFVMVLFLKNTGGKPMTYFCSQMQHNCDIEKCKKYWQRALKQHEEALSNDNRLFYFEHYGQWAKNDTDLLLYYAEFGGGAGFREREAEAIAKKTREKETKS